MNRTVLNLVLVALVLAGASYGFYRLQKQVEQKLAYPSTPSRIVMKNLPTWMPDATADSIAHSVAPRVHRSALDAQLLRDIADLLSVNPWIKKVNHVRRVYGQSAGDTIEIDCTYRAPAALVLSKGDYLLVDAEGYRLPGKFPAGKNPSIMYTADGRISLRILDGITAAPPPEGRQWPGADVQAALDMVKLLYGRRCGDEIEHINVANFKGRHSAIDAQITLETRYHTEIRWGEPVHQGFHAELSAAQKLDRLTEILDRYGRVDAGHSWLDIRLDKVMYPASENAVANNE